MQTMQGVKGFTGAFSTTASLAMEANQKIATLRPGTPRHLVQDAAAARGKKQSLLALTVARLVRVSDESWRDLNWRTSDGTVLLSCLQLHRKVISYPSPSNAVLYHDLVRQFLSRLAFGLDHPPLPQKRIPDTVKRVVTKGQRFGSNFFFQNRFHPRSFGALNIIDSMSNQRSSGYWRRWIKWNRRTWKRFRIPAVCATSCYRAHGPWHDSLQPSAVHAVQPSISQRLSSNNKLYRPRSSSWRFHAIQLWRRTARLRSSVRASGNRIIVSWTRRRRSWLSFRIYHRSRRPDSCRPSSWCPRPSYGPFGGPTASLSLIYGSSLLINAPVSGWPMTNPIEDRASCWSSACSPSGDPDIPPTKNWPCVPSCPGAPIYSERCCWAAEGPIGPRTPAARAAAVGASTAPMVSNPEGKPPPSP
eukprot:284817599_1